MLAACGSDSSGSATSADPTTQAAPSVPAGAKTIYVAGGCFWGLEKYIGLVDGVVATEVGYANGESDKATYGDGSGYAEAVKVVYDPAVAPLPFLLELFYDAIEPTSVNRQGNDIGTEYRTGIYYTDPADKAVIDASLARLQKEYTDPIAVESGPLTTYTRAEDYHQDYLEKNPGGYCHIPEKLFDAAAAARPDSSSTPATASSPLALGEEADLGAFAITPLAVRDRAGAVYDDEGERMDGQGVQVTVSVEKLRDPETGAGDDAELAIPAARLVDARGKSVQMDQLLGLPPAQAQSGEFNRRYAESYQYACIQPAGTITKAVLWFSLPAGFTPETLVIDAGAGRQAAWLLD